MSTASSSTWNWPSLPRTCSSVVVTRYEGSALADEEIKVSALVGLLHMVEIEAPVAALEWWFGLLPILFSTGKFFVRDQQLDLSLRRIQLDHVAVLDQRKHAARR